MNNGSKENNSKRQLQGNVNLQIEGVINIEIENPSPIQLFSKTIWLEDCYCWLKKNQKDK